MVKGLKYAKYHMDNNLDGLIIKVDEGFIEATGYTFEEVQSRKMTIFDLVPDYQVEEYKEIVYAAENRGESYLSHDIRCKDGSIISVHCFGEVYLDEKTGHYCTKILITDVTEQTKAMTSLSEREEQLSLQIEKIKFLAEDSNDIFIDYDIQRDYFEVSRFINGEYNVFFAKENYFNSEDRTIYDDDFDAVCQAFLVARDENFKRVLDFRSRLFKDHYNWYRLNYTTFINPNTGKSHIIGRLFDIHEEKMASMQLEKGAENDILTGVYNRTTAEKKINEILANSSESSEHALLMIDIDHLKEVNVTMGYDEGDRVLERTGYLLLNMFKQNFDILGRIDGDVFVAFIRNASDVFYVESKCMELCNRIRLECTPPGSELQVTASIGVALGKGKSDSYRKIYKKAEKALGRQTETGRDGYSF